MRLDRTPEHHASRTVLCDTAALEQRSSSGPRCLRGELGQLTLTRTRSAGRPGLWAATAPRSAMSLRLLPVYKSASTTPSNGDAVADQHDAARDTLLSHG